MGHTPIDTDDRAPLLDRRGFVIAVGVLAGGGLAVAGNGRALTSYRLEIHSDEYVEYRFTTEGEITKVMDNGVLSAEQQTDGVSQNTDGSWTAEGRTGEGVGDTYDFLGAVSTFDVLTGSCTLYLDGVEVTPAQLIDQTTPDPRVPIGGGEGYGNTVAPSAATVTVSTSTGLADALAAAGVGDVVYVDPAASIDLGGARYTVPAGVTVASDRGINGAPGALVYTDQEVDESFTLHGDARLTGLRLRGPHPGSDTSGGSSGDGVETLGAGEVDNCDVWGFSHAGIKAESGDGAHFHHNVIRENNRSGLGYGIDCQSGHPLIEYNYFNFNRHSVTSPGSNHGYTCRYNHFGPDLTDTPVDVHDPGGVRVEVHNNVIEAVVPAIGRFAGEQHQSVQVRGVPNDVATIHDNWFWNPDPPRASPAGWTDEAIIQPTEDEWTNVTWARNFYGETADVTYADVIPGYDGWRTA